MGAPLIIQVMDDHFSIETTMVTWGSSVFKNPPYMEENNENYRSFKHHEKYLPNPFRSLMNPKIARYMDVHSTKIVFISLYRMGPSYVCWFITPSKYSYLRIIHQLVIMYPLVI